MSEIGLGEALRLEREKRGLTLEQVASATKIGMKYLISIEADQYGDLPAKPFVRGFLVSYCRFVGLDADEFFLKHEDYLNAKYAELPSRTRSFSGYAFERKATERSRTLLVSFMAGFVIAGGILILIIKPTLRHKKLSHLEQLKQAHTIAALPTPTPEPSPVSASATAPVPAPVSTPVPQPSVAPVADPLEKGDSLEASEVKHKVVFKAREDVWVRYRADDRQPMRLLLRKGKLLVIKAKDLIRFQLADGEEIEFRYNDRGPYTTLSKAPQVVIQNSNPTAFFPPQPAESIKEVFPGTQPLSKIQPAASVNPQ